MQQCTAVYGKVRSRSMVYKRRFVQGVTALVGMALWLCLIRACSNMAILAFTAAVGVLALVVRILTAIGAGDFLGRYEGIGHVVRLVVLLLLFGGGAAAVATSCSASALSLAALLLVYFVCRDELIPEGARQKLTFLDSILILAAGILLAAAFVESDTVIAHIAAAAISLAVGKKRLPVKEKNEIPLGLRFTAAGWRRSLILLLSFFAAGSFMISRASYQAQTPLPSIASRIAGIALEIREQIRMGEALRLIVGPDVVTGNIFIGDLFTGEIVIGGLLLMALFGTLLLYLRGRDGELLLILDLVLMIPMTAMISKASDGLQVLCVLIAFDLAAAIEMVRWWHGMAHRDERRREELLEREAGELLAVTRKAQEEKELQALREEALHAQFDMEKALREGHITIVASEAAVRPVQGATKN